MEKWHKLSNTKLHRAWTNMKQRCNNPNNPDYSDYGSRGIKVCDEWLNDFKSFYDWSMSHGYSDELTIDRIDVNGNYEPSNCRWVTMKVQTNNKRCNIFITLANKEITLKEFAKETGVKYTTLYMRYRKGGVESVLQRVHQNGKQTSC